MANVKPEELANEILKALSEYSEEVTGQIEQSARAILKEAKAEVKAKSPVGSGQYARGWATSITSKNGRLEGRVYNKAKPGLTHLLEHGHATRNGTGRRFADTPAHPHIESVNAEVQTKLEEAIKEAIANG